MLRVAYAGDDLDKSEAVVIRDFCKTIGVTQDQLNRVVKEVVTTLKSTGRVCPKCGADNDSDAAFCSKCGTGLERDVASVNVKLEIPEQGIAIEFADSTASGFAKALEIAKATPAYQSAKRGRGTSTDRFS